MANQPSELHTMLQPMTRITPMPRSILLLDIGSGTQDVLYYTPGRELENCPKFVLPAPARLVAQRVEALTRQGASVYLHGSNMGGGFFGALKKHLEAGLQVAVHPEAAFALHDNPDTVRRWGFAIEDRCPRGHSPVALADYDAGWWNAFLGMCGLAYPDQVVAAAQDHGYHPDILSGGNRVGRFMLWRDLLNRHEGNPSALVYEVAPEPMTRLAAIQKATGGGPVADSAAAALLGALFMPDIAARSHREGVLVVNAGNSHLVAFLVYRERVLGVYEHHTGMLSPEKLAEDLTEFRRGWLTDDMVRESGGHGCMYLPLPEEAEGFRPAYILGPRRELLRGQGQFIAPGGDMMLAGCFGLLKGCGGAQG